MTTYIRVTRHWFGVADRGRAIFDTVWFFTLKDHRERTLYSDLIKKRAEVAKLIYIFGE